MRIDDAFVGIDVAFAHHKRLPVVVCTWQGRVLKPLPLREIKALVPPAGGGNVAALDARRVASFARDVARYLRAIEAACGVTIRRVGIDAPSDPKEDGRRRRRAEAGLDACGISCITTPSLREFDAIREAACAHVAGGGPASRVPHANQLWMLVGFELFRQLRDTWECLEVFPHAIVASVDPRAARKRKSTSEGLRARLRAAARWTGWPQPLAPLSSLGNLGYGGLHDKLDAYLAAWVAALDESERLPIGEAPRDVIWVPRLDDPPSPPARS
jgi:Protein of unknown function (DUF429)